MDDINTIVIVGRLTRDGELKFTNSNSPMGILNLNIAVNRSRKQMNQWQNEVSFFEVTIFGKRAESLAQYMTKGKQIAVQGSLRQERWQDRETGKNRSRLYIAAENIEMISGNGNVNGETSNSPYGSNEDPYNGYGAVQF